MSDIFKDGSVPFPDYDRDDTANFTQKAEFIDDVFVYGNLYGDDEVDFGEGMVQLKYKGGVSANGLAYTGALDKMIEEKLENITGGLITCSGSEQGMQGHYEDDECVESYLSVDIGEFETA